MSIASDRWMDRGLCRAANIDPAIFLYPETGRPSERERSQDIAARICAQCPVQHICVLEEHAPGIWGGLTLPERKKAAADRRKAARGGEPHPSMRGIEQWKQRQRANAKTATPAKVA